MAKETDNSMWECRTLLTISEYAKERNVQRKTIYLAITQGRITTTLIGKKKHEFINWELFKDVPFKPYNT